MRGRKRVGSEIWYAGAESDNVPSPQPTSIEVVDDDGMRVGFAVKEDVRV